MHMQYIRICNCIALCQTAVALLFSLISSTHTTTKRTTCSLSHSLTHTQTLHCICMRCMHKHLFLMKSTFVGILTTIPVAFQGKTVAKQNPLRLGSALALALPYDHVCCLQHAAFHIGYSIFSILHICILFTAVYKCITVWQYCILLLCSCHFRSCLNALTSRETETESHVIRNAVTTPTTVGITHNTRGYATLFCAEI